MTQKIPKIWNDGECWILGGGPSIPKQFGIPNDVIQKVLEGKLPPSAYSPYLSPIHNKNVIGVNAAYKIGTWIKVVFFGDKGFFIKHKDELAKFHNLKFACSPPSIGLDYETYGIRNIPRNSRKAGISSKPTEVKWNFNSGAAAISLAYHLGAKKIYLLGFDMKKDDNEKTHWHSEYKNKINEATFKRHMKGWGQIAKDAKQLGIEIINVNPDSAIDVFPKMNLKDIL